MGGGTWDRWCHPTMSDVAELLCSDGNGWVSNCQNTGALKMYLSCISNHSASGLYQIKSDHRLKTLYKNARFTKNTPRLGANLISLIVFSGVYRGGLVTPLSGC
uniref:Uncharacterized protein n=1 Tax=Cacopsylla melanoneura TaxID=428564 RepID=A0A8D9BTL7_9HEMI